MSYQVAGKANGVIGGVFQTEADARAVIEEIVVEGIENEANWLMELVHATKEGGAVNQEDEGYVRRILSATEGSQRKVALECAKERIYADYKVIKSVETPN